MESTINVPPLLTPSDKKQFAFETMSDRVPAILTKTIDTCSKLINTAESKYDEQETQEMKSIIGKLSKLRSELMTDKPLRFLEDNKSDTMEWNMLLKCMINESGEKPPSWFSESWIFLECFIYRQVMSIFHGSKYFTKFDPFYSQKNQGLQDSFPTIKIFLEFLENILSKPLSESDKKTNFLSFILVALWGNKFDLSLSGGIVQNSYHSDPFANIHNLDKYILQNDYESVYNILTTKSEARIDMVIDNAGFELCSDLIFAEFLLSSQLASTIYFYPKSMPWFVSDVTYENFHDTIAQLASNEDQYLSKYGRLWTERIKNKSFVLNFESDIANARFWTLPYTYDVMEKNDNTLYQELSKSDLIIFKGDLNYRKLVGDRSWPVDTPFATALRGFKPAPLVSLRTLKADVVVGITNSQAENVQNQHADWMVTGSYAVISFQG